MAQGKFEYLSAGTRDQQLQQWDYLVKNNLNDRAELFFKSFIHQYFNIKRLKRLEYEYSRDRITDLKALYKAAENNKFCQDFITGYCDTLPIPLKQIIPFMPDAIQLQNEGKTRRLNAPHPGALFSLSRRALLGPQRFATHISAPALAAAPPPLPSEYPTFQMPLPQSGEKVKVNPMQAIIAPAAPSQSSKNSRLKTPAAKRSNNKVKADPLWSVIDPAKDTDDDSTIEDDNKISAGTK